MSGKKRPAGKPNDALQPSIEGMLIKKAKPEVVPKESETKQAAKGAEEVKGSACYGEEGLLWEDPNKRDPLKGTETTKSSSGPAKEAATKKSSAPAKERESKVSSSATKEQKTKSTTKKGRGTKIKSSRKKVESSSESESGSDSGAESESGSGSASESGNGSGSGSESGSGSGSSSESGSGSGSGSGTGSESESGNESGIESGTGSSLYVTTSDGVRRLKKQELKNNKVIFRIISHKTTLDFSSEGESAINKKWVAAIRKTLMQEDVDPRAAIAFAAKKPKVNVLKMVKKYRASLLVPLRKLLDTFPSRAEFERKWDPETMSLARESRAYVVYLLMWDCEFGTLNAKYKILGGGLTSGAPARVKTYNRDLERSFQQWKKLGNDYCPDCKRGLHRLYFEWRVQNPTLQKRTDMVFPIIFTKDRKQSYSFEAMFEVSHGIRICGSVEGWGDQRFWEGTKSEGGPPLSEASKRIRSVGHKRGGKMLPRRDDEAICAVVEMFQLANRSWTRAGGYRYFCENNKPHGPIAQCKFRNRSLGSAVAVAIRRIDTDKTFTDTWNRVLVLKEWPHSGQHIFNRSHDKLLPLGFRLQVIWPDPTVPRFRAKTIHVVVPCLEKSQIELILSYLPRFPIINYDDISPRPDDHACTICQSINSRDRAEICKYGCPMRLCASCACSEYTQHDCPERRAALLVPLAGEKPISASTTSK